MSEMTQQLRIDAEHPWPGLMPFSEEAQAFFHGRDQEAAELQRLIKRETLTVLFGQSGLGKSSLLNAGLFPRLRQEDFLPVYIRLDVTEAAPPFVDQVKAALAANCRAHQVDAPPPAEGMTLWGWFHQRDTDFWSARNRLLTPVLVFDQFEEIFTLGRHGEALEARCRAFLEEVADLVEDRMPASLAAQIEQDPAIGDALDYGKHAWKVVFSFREDYLPEFEGLRALIRPIMQNRMRLARMSGEQAFQSIRKAGGHLVPEAVAEQIVRFVAAPRVGRETSELGRLEVEPALMSVVCRELNNRRLAAGEAEISADLLLAGAQQQIIHDYYEDCLADIDPAVRVFVEDNLLTDAGYRDSYALDDALLMPGVSQAAIDALIGRRLLRLEERSGVLRVELTHDVLTRVAKESRDNRKEAERLRQAQEAEAARRRRTRRLALLVGSSLTVAIGLAVIFAVLLGQANEQRAQLLKTQSAVMLSRANTALEQGIPGEPYAMLAEAIRLNPDNRAAVARAVSLFGQRRQPVHLGGLRLGGAAELAWLKDGAYLVAGGETARVSSGGQVSTLTIEAANNDHVDAGLVRLNIAPRPALAGLPGRNAQTMRLPDGSALIPFVSPNFMLHLFDPLSGERALPPLQLAGQPRGMVISRNGQWLGAVSADGRLTLARLDGSATRHFDVELKITGEEPPLAFVSDQGQAFVWNGATGVLASFSGEMKRFDEVPGKVALNPAGTHLALVRGRMASLFRLPDGTPDGAPIEHPATVRDLAFSPDGKYLATASLDKQARVFEVTTHRMVAPPMRHDGPVLVVRWGEEGATLFTAAADGAARVWQALKGELLAEPMLHREAVVDVLPQPGGEYMLALTAGNELNLWRWRHAGQPHAFPVGFEGEVSALAVDAAGQTMAWGSRQGELMLMLGGEVPRRLWSEAPPSAQPGEAVGALAFSPDGRILASAQGPAIRFLDTTGGKPQGRLAKVDRPVVAMSFSVAGNLLAVTTDDRVVRVWDRRTEQWVGARSLHRQSVLAAALSPDERLLLVADRERLVLWDVVNGLPQGELRLGELSGERLLLADFVDAGQVLLVFGDKVLRLPLRPEKAGETRLPARGEGAAVLTLGGLRAWTAKRSPDGKQLAIGALDGRIRRVDLGRLALVGEAMRHDDAVLGLTWSADGLALASWSRDRSVRFWGAETANPVADVMWLEGEARQVALVKGGATVLQARAVVQPLGVLPAGQVPAWLPQLLEAAGGVRIEQGVAVRLEQRPGLPQAGQGDGEWANWLNVVLQRWRGDRQPSGEARQ